MFMGGAGKQLALTASALVDRGHEVSLYTYIGNTMEHTIDSRIKYVYERNAPKSKISEYLETPGNIRNIVKMVKPDVVISWRANAGCMAVLGCIGLPVKVVFSERSDPYMETNWMLKIATKICDYSDGGVFQTEKAKNFYKRLDKKSIVCPNPVNPNLVLPDIVPIEKRKDEIAWVGRITNTQKRMDVAIDAFFVIHEQLPDVKLSFYGDGVDMEWTRQYVKDKGLDQFVIFHGATKNIIEVVAKSRMLMLSSDYEGIPNVVIESFIAGTPVVATDCSPGGARLLIDDGINGYVVPMRDYTHLAEKSIEVINNNKLSNNYIHSARIKLMEFEPSKIFDKWNLYLEKVVNK